MIELDPGHRYELDGIDGGQTRFTAVVQYVKREGPGYPGNVGHHPGITIQENLRSDIARLKYLDLQDPCAENLDIIRHLREAMRLLELRAARRHGSGILRIRLVEEIEKLPACPRCGHVVCNH